MKTDRLPVQKQLMKNDKSDTYSPNIRVNCAGLAKLLGTSRTSIKRFVDSGLIALDAEGMVNVKQATNAILNKSNRVKKNLLKFDDAEKTGLRQTISHLQGYLLGMKATQAAQVQAFIDLLTTDSTLKKAVKQGNRQAIMQAFNNLGTNNDV